MIPDGTYTAVVDRIDDDTATLLLAAEDGDVSTLDLPAEDLPGDARHRNAVLRVTVADGALTGATYQIDESRHPDDPTRGRFDGPS